jgi:hypothetical protein
VFALYVAIHVNRELHGVNDSFIFVVSSSDERSASQAAHIVVSLVRIPNRNLSAASRSGVGSF